MSMGETNNHLGWNFKRTKGEDRLSPADRSSLMSKIRSRGTKFENEFVKLIKAATRNKFEQNAKDLIGKPDVLFRKEKICIFLDSDYWHGWQFPRWKNLLKNDYWKEKIDRNRKRDRKVTSTLRRNGWTVVRLWGHDVKNTEPYGKVSKILRHLANL